MQSRVKGIQKSQRYLAEKVYKKDKGMAMVPGDLAVAALVLGGRAGVYVHVNHWDMRQQVKDLEGKIQRSYFGWGCCLARSPSRAVPEQFS